MLNPKNRATNGFSFSISVDDAYTSIPACAAKDRREESKVVGLSLFLHTSAIYRTPEVKIEGSYLRQSG